MRRGTAQIRAIFRFTDTYLFVRKMIFCYSHTDDLVSSLGTQCSCPKVTLYWKAIICKQSSRKCLFFSLIEYGIWLGVANLFPFHYFVYLSPKRNRVSGMGGGGLARFWNTSLLIKGLGNWIFTSLTPPFTLPEMDWESRYVIYPWRKGEAALLHGEVSSCCVFLSVQTQEAILFHFYFCFFCTSQLFPIIP